MTLDAEQETTPESNELDGNIAHIDNEADESNRNRRDASPINYTSPTAVQPKGLLAEYKLASHEHILNVFSTGKSWSRALTMIITLTSPSPSAGTSLNRGIRSLPNALDPDFRRRLFEVLVSSVKNDRTSTPKLFNSGLPSSPLLSTTGFNTLAKVHPRSGDFTAAEYLTSEYDRSRIAQKFDRLRSKVACVSPKEFIVKASPSPPKGRNKFSELPRISPGTERDVWLSHIHKDKDEPPPTSPTRSRPFTAGGKVQLATHLLGHADEVMVELGRLLQEDWPMSFHTCFIEDQTQAIVACFDEVQAAAEGDLSSYMHALAKSSHPVMSDYKLVKDGVQWGVRDADTASRFYAFWPPWARRKAIPQVIAKNEDERMRSEAQEPPVPAMVPAAAET